MLIGLAIVALVLLVGVGAAVSDRSLATLAEQRASEALSAPFGPAAAVVRVVGRPFLPQAVRGRYREVHVSGAGLTVGDMTGASLDARLHTVYLPLRDLLRHRVEEITCDRVGGQLVLPFGELARVAPIPGFSQLARVNGQAVWTVGNGGALWLRIRGISVAGIAVPTLVVNQLLPALNVPVALPELPYGLRIDDLRPTPAGLVVTGSAEAPVFRRAPVAGPGLTR